MLLDRIFSEENLLDYAGACIDLAVEIPECNFDTLVIPSRGAVPIFLGMLHAMPKFTWSNAHREFYENLGIQSMIAPLLPDSSPVTTRPENKHRRVLLLPFTADLKLLDKTEAESIDYTRKTRAYWAEVASSFLMSPQKRKENPHFRVFTDVILRAIERRSFLAESYERFPQATQTALVDTVISGRAATDILKSFDLIYQRQESAAKTADEKVAAARVLPNSFLLIDENGRKLRQEFGTYLNRKKAMGQIKMLRCLKRIVSEDEGASLEGVAAVVYPSIMEGSANLVRGKDPFFIGAGSWHIPIEENYLDNFKRFMSLMYTAIDARYAQDYGDGKSGSVLENFRQARQGFVDFARTRDILVKHRVEKDDLTNYFMINPSLGIEAPYETGSHVVHVPFTSTTTQNLVSKMVAAANSCPGSQVKYDQKHAPRHSLG